VAAGGYHHHVGLNTWAGVGAPPPPPGAIGLRHFVLQLPDEAARGAVLARLLAAGVAPEPAEGGLLIHDPAKNAILLTTRP
jgi:catechol 2,3-dioxygenase